MPSTSGAALRRSSRTARLAPLVLAVTLTAAQAWAFDPLGAPEVAPLHRAVLEHPDDLPLRLQFCEELRRQGRVEARRLAAESYAEALRRHRKDPDLLVAYGQLRIEQGYLSQGASLLRRALECNPERVDAEFGLARLALRDYLRFLEPKPLAESRRRLDRVLQLVPDHRDALYFRALTWLEAGEVDSAFEAARRLTRAWPTDAWGDLVLGALSVATGNMYEAAGAMERGLARLPEVEREPFQTLADVDAAAEEARQEKIESGRDAATGGFWKAIDPTPASPLNERVLEHQRRIVVSELLYGIREKRIRGWETAPGEAIIRFGLPAARHYSWGRRDGLALAPPGLEQVHKIDGEMVTLEFVDRNLSGRWVQPFNHGQATAMELATITHQNVGPDLWPGPPLDCRTDLVQFRGVGGGTRLELCLAARQNRESPEALRRDAAVFDTAWGYQARDTNAFDGAGRVVDRETGQLDLVDLVRFDAHGDSVWVGASVEAPAARSGGRWLHKIGLRRFPAEVLSLSDLLLLDRVSFAPTSSRFSRPDGEAVPNPRHIYWSGESVPLYFEAYNLTPSAGGRYDYSLSLQVEEAAPPHRRQLRSALIDLKPAPGPLVAARFEEQAAGPTLERLLDLSVGRLPAGSYRLRVRLEQSGGLNAEATTRFRVVEPRAGSKQDAELQGR